MLKMLSCFYCGWSLSLLLSVLGVIFCIAKMVRKGDRLSFVRSGYPELLMYFLLRVMIDICGVLCVPSEEV